MMSFSGTPLLFLSSNSNNLLISVLPTLSITVGVIVFVVFVGTRIIKRLV